MWLLLMFQVENVISGNVIILLMLNYICFFFFFRIRKKMSSQYRTLDLSIVSIQVNFSAKPWLQVIRVRMVASQCLVGLQKSCFRHWWVFRLSERDNCTSYGGHRIEECNIQSKTTSFVFCSLFYLGLFNATTYSRARCPRLAWKYLDFSSYIPRWGFLLYLHFRVFSFCLFILSAWLLPMWPSQEVHASFCLYP